MNELRSGADRVHQRGSSMDINPADDVKGNDDRDARAAVLVTRLPVLNTGARPNRQPRVYTPHGDVSIRLNQGVFDDAVRGYLKTYGWVESDFDQIRIDCSLSEISEVTDPKLELCWALLKQAVNKGCLKVFIMIPKSETLIQRGLEYLAQKLENADAETAKVYETMRKNVRTLPPKTGLSKLIGPDAQ